MGTGIGSILTEIANHKKAVGNGVYEVVGSLDTAAFLRDVEPDVVKIDFDARGDPVRHFNGGSCSIPPAATPGRVP
jgi:hypothetical protein